MKTKHCFVLRESTLRIEKYFAHESLVCFQAYRCFSLYVRSFAQKLMKEDKKMQ